MADTRKPTYRIAIAGPDGFRRVSELFPAGLFPGGQKFPGLFRVRVDRAWHMPGGTKYAYLSLADALAVAGWPRQEAPRPNLARGARVSVPNGRVLDGRVLCDATWTATDPFAGPDGRWRVFVVGRREPVLVDELRPVSRQEGQSTGRAATLPANG